MLKNPAPLTSSRKPPRVLPISYDLPLYGPSTCLVHVSPEALNYCAVPKGPPGWVMRPTLERRGRACSPESYDGLGRARGLPEPRLPCW